VRAGYVKCAGTLTPHVNRFPAGTLHYQETELNLVYILIARVPGPNSPTWVRDKGKYLSALRIQSGLEINKNFEVFGKNEMCKAVRVPGTY
jgi:hypothetical protein